MTRGDTDDATQRRQASNAEGPVAAVDFSKGTATKSRLQKTVLAFQPAG